MAEAGPERINPALAGLVRPLEGLRENPRNARLHGERNLQAISASLSEFGQQAPLVALRDGMVLSGNGRLRAMLTLGWRRAAVMEFDSEDEARAAAYAIGDKEEAGPSAQKWLQSKCSSYYGGSWRSPASLGNQSSWEGFTENFDRSLSLVVSALFEPAWQTLLMAEELLREGCYGQAGRTAIESFALFSTVCLSNVNGPRCGDLAFRLLYISRLARLDRFVDYPVTLYNDHPILIRLRRRLRRDQDGRCVYCGSQFGRDAHLDHVLPKVQGGDDSESNLVLACRNCNLSKGGRTPEQWAEAKMANGSENLACDGDAEIRDGLV